MIKVKLVRQLSAKTSHIEVNHIQNLEFCGPILIAGLDHPGVHTVVSMKGQYYVGQKVLFLWFNSLCLSFGRR